jgi:sec-independent protein translocase protein TatA
MAVPGATELIIILVIVIAIFGVGRLAGIGGALGSSVRDFRKSVRDDDKPVTRTDTTTGTAESVRVYDTDDTNAPRA